MHALHSSGICHAKNGAMSFLGADGLCTKHEAGKLDVICASPLRLFKAMAKSSSVADILCVLHNHPQMTPSNDDEKQMRRKGVRQGAVQLLLLLYCLPPFHFLQMAAGPCHDFQSILYNTLSLLLLIHKLHSLPSPFNILVPGLRASWFHPSTFSCFLSPCSLSWPLPPMLQHSRHIQRRPQGPVVRNLLPKLTRPLPGAQ